MSELRVWTSGWQYKHWKEPERKTFEKWRRSVPDDFVYAVKLNRFITHLKRLNIGRDSVERSYGTMAGLGPKLAVVLVQLPPRLKFDEERAERFFRMVAPRRRRHAIEPRTRRGSPTTRSPSCAALMSRSSWGKPRTGQRTSP